MLEHQKKNENDLNDLLAEYWVVRRDAGVSFLFSLLVHVIDQCSTEVYMETLADKFGISVS